MSPVTSTPRPEDDDAVPSGLAFWPAVGAATLAWVVGVWWLVAANPRLLASWHGFVHAGIAARFPSPTFTPENPFFAGEVISYYWVYQWVGHVISRIAGIDPLHAFQALSLGSLGALVAGGALAGRRLYRSTAAGLLVGYLALVGVNPLGLAIAGAKYLAHRAPPMPYSQSDSGGDVFVTNIQADRRMARPILGAMYVETDWRRGQNLAWFFDVSSRGPALALLVLLAGLLVQQGSSALLAPALLAIGALATALNPIAGLATAGALNAAAATIWIVSRRQAAPATLGRSIAVTAGALLAAPTYLHLAKFPGAIDINQIAEIPVQAATVVAGFLLLLPLAVAGVKASGVDRVPALSVLTLAGVFLLLPLPFVGLSEGNEHNFANAACCLLAIPAAGWSVSGRGGGSLRQPGARAVLLVAAFMPTTLGMLVAFAGREPLPLAFEGRMLRRTPAGGALDSLYRWISTSTPDNAILITDPEESVKMSGNVSEVPALTARAIFVDQPTYMTAPYPDRAKRSVLAAHATSGLPLDMDQLAYLRALRRPLYVLTFHADRGELLQRLVHVFGTPSFHQGQVAAFALDPASAAVPIRPSASLGDGTDAR